MVNYFQSGAVEGYNGIQLTGHPLIIDITTPIIQLIHLISNWILNLPPSFLVVRNPSFIVLDA